MLLETGVANSRKVGLKAGRSSGRDDGSHAPLLTAIREQYVLDFDFGIHSVSYWWRVRENGLRLAERTGADPQVVELFAFLHDSRRFNDGRDPDHGRRAAEYARGLRGTLVHLDDAAFELLTHACTYHTDGRREGHPTVLICWDADRLDLGRVGIHPDPRYLCTGAARDPAVIRWAYERSVGG
jgi:uncharacterized protein